MSNWFFLSSEEHVHSAGTPPNTSRRRAEAGLTLESITRHWCGAETGIYAGRDALAARYLMSGRQIKPARTSGREIALVQCE